MNKQPTVLVVDDSDFSRAILVKIFHDDYHVLQAADGKIALDVLQKNEVDIVLLDIFMPHMDGFEVLSCMRENAVWSKIPVLVNTQYGEDEMEIKALKYGATDFITKPYNPDIILHRVKNVMEKTVLKRRKFEQDLNEMDIQLKSLIDTVPGGIGIYEIDDKIKNIFFNDTFCHLLGHTREEYESLLKKDSLYSVHEDDRQRLWKEIMEMPVKGNPFKSMFRIRTKNGNIKWLNLSAVKFKEMDEKSIYYAVFIDITEERVAQEKLENSFRELRYRAERDTLTGIYNRSKFCQATQKMLLENDRDDYILVRWDIDRFKVINELFGNSVGDKILIKFALTLYDAVRNKGTCGRLEADHFVICAPKDMINVDTLQVTLNQEASLLTPDYNIVFCAGIYAIEDKTLPIDQMCDRAELALRTVKGNYINRIGKYNDAFRKIILEEQEIVSDMNQSLLTGQFDIYLQPILDTLTQKIVSAEALVRWNHTQKGFIMPDVFIPIFERNGFITKVDAYVWEEACKYISKMRKDGHKLLPISVNISRVDLYNPHLCELILSTLEKYQLDISMIKLEITETAYTDNPNQLLEAMKKLKSKGFCLLIDDFGSGYSSLNMLKSIPADTLKIDMRFIDDLENSKRARSILASVVQMAKLLKMEVVAEGVETKFQLDFLNNVGCDYVQGYYFSKPITKNDFTFLLNTEYLNNKATPY